MSRNEEILVDWKPIHDKGMLAYVIPYALRFLLIIAGVGVISFLIYRSKNTNAINSVLIGNTVIFIIVTLSRISDWFKKEKQYKDIIKLFEMANKCPMCSTKISTTDKVCPSCGVTLGIREEKI